MSWQVRLQQGCESNRNTEWPAVKVAEDSECQLLANSRAVDQTGPIP
jgi:hypothetical protein